MVSLSTGASTCPAWTCPCHACVRQLCEDVACRQRCDRLLRRRGGETRCTNLTRFYLNNPSRTLIIGHESQATVPHDPQGSTHTHTRTRARMCEWGVISTACAKPSLLSPHAVISRSISRLSTCSSPVAKSAAGVHTFGGGARGVRRVANQADRCHLGERAARL